MLFILRSHFSKQRHDVVFSDHFERELEEQMVVLDPTYNRHERLLRITPLDVNSATYEELRLLPRVTEAIA